MSFDAIGQYRCVCGKEFDRAQSFNGHKARCKQHQLQKYGSLNHYEQASNIQNEKRTKTQRLKWKLKKDYELAEWIKEQHTCERCGKIMTEKYGSGRFCSKYCANSRSQSEETKQKISNSIQEHNYKSEINSSKLKYYQNPKVCCICGKQLEYEKRCRQTCSPDCTNQLIRNKVLQRIADGTHNGWISRNVQSYAEQFWEKVLIQNNIQYKKEFKVVTANTYYFLDFLIDDKIDLEIDGKQHQEESRRQHDIVRDINLQKIGYTVYRIPYVNPKNEQSINEQINDFLQFYKQL